MTHRRGKLLAVISLVILLTGTALALASISFKIGTVANYDFGGYGPGFPIPGTVQIQAFTMKPGDVVPWHFHKAVSYVILTRGTLTERHLIGPGHCSSEELTAGSAFVETPGRVHMITNTGDDVAVIWWATVFPKRDGIVQFTPEFKTGGVYPVKAPNCN